MVVTVVTVVVLVVVTVVLEATHESHRTGHKSFTNPTPVWRPHCPAPPTVPQKEGSSRPLQCGLVVVVVVVVVVEVVVVVMVVVVVVVVDVVLVPVVVVVVVAVVVVVVQLLHFTGQLSRICFPRNGSLHTSTSYCKHEAGSPTPLQAAVVVVTVAVVAVVVVAVVVVRVVEVVDVHELHRTVHVAYTNGISEQCVSDDRVWHHSGSGTPWQVNGVDDDTVLLACAVVAVVAAHESHINGQKF